MDDLQEAKFVILALVGLYCSPQDQLKAVLSILDEESSENIDQSIDNYITSNLDKDSTYYVIEKDFWQAWLSAASTP